MQTIKCEVKHQICTKSLVQMKQPFYQKQHFATISKLQKEFEESTHVKTIKCMLYRKQEVYYHLPYCIEEH